VSRLLARRHIPLAASLAVLGCMYLFGAIAYEHFTSPAVVRDLLLGNAFLLVAAIGATFVILAGGIDLSVGSVMAFTSILVARLVERAGWHPAAAITAALVVGAAFGAMQGILIQAFDLPAFLVTLAGLFLVRGAAFAVHPQSLAIRHSFIASTLNERLSLSWTVRGGELVFPITVPAVLAILISAWFVLRHTRFGRAVYAVGDDEQSALLMGLPVGSVRVRVYAMSGLLSALAGVVFLLGQQSGDPAACRGYELDAIAAVVIGGTLLRGGIGSVLGTAVGVAILGLIQTLITFQGNLSSWWTRIIVGALVLAFVGLQRALSAIAGRASAG
jgi:galactofuranose transport system permease protein